MADFRVINQPYRTKFFALCCKCGNQQEFPRNTTMIACRCGNVASIENVKNEQAEHEHQLWVHQQERERMDSPDYRHNEIILLLKQILEALKHDQT